MVSIQKPTNRRAKPKASDFDTEIQSTVLLACHCYRNMLCTEHAFPSELDQERYARQAWLLACQDYEVDHVATRENYKVIRARGSQVRGKLKHHVRPLTVSHYGFKASDADKMKTQSLVTLLKDKNTLVYKDHEARKGLFENPVLLKAIKNQWFPKPHAEGVIFHLYFNLIPLPTMALVFTVIENCIDEWSSGVYQPLDFTEKSYRDIYEQHLASLEKWQSHTLGRSILARLQQQLHDKARIHSKAGTLEQSQLSKITDDDSEAAAREAMAEDEERMEEQ
ncbi:hypothetical protein K439DRAFT_1397491 [Ramaria rubella]|nr:hypothetical protein K439DRAFT_1397491 [Ramaria rubella]